MPIKKGLKITSIVLLSILVLMGSLVLAIRSSKTQTYLTQHFAAYFSEMIGAKVTIGAVDIDFFRTVVLEEVYVEDLHRDTLIYMQKLKLEIANLDFKGNAFTLSNVTLENANLNLAQYKGEHDLNLQFILDVFDTPRDTTDTIPSKPPLITVKNIELKNFHFTYRYENDTVKMPFGFNTSDIDVRNINGKFIGFYLQGDTINAHIQNLSAIEKSGFLLRELSADFRICDQFMVFKNFTLASRYSFASGDFKFGTHSYRDYNGFEELVDMRGKFNHSHIELADLSYFAPELEGIKKSFEFSGEMRGTEKNLKGKNLDITFAKSSHFKGNVSFSGLPDWDETFIHLDIFELKTNKRDLETIPLPPFNSRQLLKLPTWFANVGDVSFKGDFTGFPNNYVAYGDFITPHGTISSDIAMEINSEKKEAKYKGNIEAYDLDLGYIFGIAPTVGKLSLNANVSGSGRDVNDLNAIIEGKVDHIEFNHYDYKKLNVSGKFAKNIFTGMFDVEDENIALNFDGNIDFTHDVPIFDFKTDIRKANLAALNFIQTKHATNLSTHLDINISGDEIDNITGHIEAQNTILTSNGVNYPVKYLDLMSMKGEGYRSLELESDIADATITGIFYLEELADAFIYLAEKYLPAIYEGDKPHVLKHEQNFNFDIYFKNAEALSKLFLDDVTISENSTLKGNYNTVLKDFNLVFNCDKILMFGKKMDYFYVRSANESGALTAMLGCDRIYLSDSTTVDHLFASGRAHENNLDFKLQWFNEGKLKNKAKINANAVFQRSNKLTLHILPSDIYIADSLWKVDTKNEILIDSNSVMIHDLAFNYNEQTVKVEGQVSEDKSDELKFYLTNFNLSDFNPFFKDEGIELNGVLNGQASISGFYSSLIFSTSVGFKNFAFNDEVLGDGSVVSIWNAENKSISLTGKFMRDLIPTIGFSGFYYPVAEDNNLDLLIQFQKTKLKLFEKFTVGLFSDLKGIATGDIKLTGSSKKPVLKGKLEIQKGGFKFDYTNTSYSFNGGATFDRNLITLQDVIMFDSKGNEGSAYGTITHDYFADLHFDLGIKMKNLFCLNTNEVQNNLYYGKAYATGLIKVKGTPENTVIDIDAKTEKGTQFNIPLSGSEEISENNFISFVSKDSTVKKVKKYEVDLSGIQLNFNLETTNDAEVQLIFDQKIGDVIKASGSGMIKMEINTLGQFKMFGDYVVHHGDYLFTLKNVINKRFKIEDGGTISWFGDPFGADINLAAIYKLRTSLAEIIADSSKRRVPVDVKLMLTGKLMNPIVKFDISLPTSDEKIKNDVRSVVNSGNDAELNRQVFSLLMLSKFSPVASTQTNSSQTNAASANSSELLSNQLSNWLSKTSLGEQFNIGVKGDISNQEIQVALSRQLFNNRLTIDGNFGKTNKTTTTTTNNASNIIGDVNIEYKVTADGRLRVRAFNISNDYSFGIVNSQFKQGLGIYYRKDFDSFEELLQQMKRKKKATPVN